MIKLFASDLDGTLLNLLHEVDGTIRRAVSEITAAGLHVVPATGRIEMPMGKHGFVGLKLESVCANGSIIRDANGDILKTFEIAPDFLCELVTAFPQVCWDVSTPEGMFIMGSYEDHQKTFENQSIAQRILFKGMRARGGMDQKQYFDQTLDDVLKHKICKINTHMYGDGLSQEINAFLAEHSDTVVNAPFNPTMYEITDKSCNKGTSVAWLANYLGIEEDEVAVYGDGGNDIEMLKYFKHSYATSNASSDAKAAALETIGSCTFHAVPKHMLKTLHTQNC